MENLELTIKKGYKQTDVGIIPEDWEVKMFGDVTDVITCGVAATPEYVNEGVGKPFLSAQNVRSGKVVYDNHKYISQKLFEQITKNNKPEKGDLLYTRVGAGIGEAGVIEDDYIFAIYVSLTLIKTDKRKLFSYFLLHLLNSPRYKFLAKNTQFAGGGVQNLNVQVVREFQLPIPPLPEQQAIAEVLSDVDALITSLDQLITKKRNIKQGTMQLLLTGKKRLVAEIDKGFKQTEIGIIPEDWEVKQLGQLFEITSSKRVFQSEWKTKGVPFYRARELAVLGEQGSVNNELFISREMYENFKRVFGVPEPEDILVTGVGTLGKTYVVENNHEFYFKDGNIIWFKIDGKINSNYLSQLYLTPLIKKQIEDASAGTTVGTYTITGANKTKIPVPPIEEQKAIAQILSEMDAEIEALETQRDKYKAVKQGMMQELLTGKTRLV